MALTQVPRVMQEAEAAIPTGVVFPYAGAAAPTGWLLCFGQAVSRTTYADLFAALSTTFGAGDGSTTFNLPDLRGRVSVGKDDMGGSAANRMTSGGSGVNGAALGASGGAQTHVLQINQLPSHAHPTRVSVNTASPANSNTTGGLMLNTSTATTYAANSGSVSNTAGEQIGVTGSDVAHNNTQPSLILNHIIKV